MRTIALNLATTLLLLNLVASSTSAQAIPQTVHLHARKVSPELVRRSSNSRYRRRDVGPITRPLENFFRNTDLQWYTNMTVGTPPQVVPVLFDTGSHETEVFSSLCKSCSKHYQTLFDPSKSSTFIDQGNEHIVEFVTGDGVEPVNPTTPYVVTLRSALDAMSIGGIAVANASFSVITNETEEAQRTIPTIPYSVIHGLSTVADGLMAGLVNQGLPQIFGLYLTPRAVGDAEITLGGIDTTKFIGEPIFGKLEPDLDWDWQLKNLHISVNGQTTDALAFNQAIFFDSGTSNIVLWPKQAEAVYALISPDIKPYADLPGAYGIACSKIPSLKADIDFTFTSESGVPFNLTVPSSELNVGPFSNNQSHCQTVINSQASSGPFLGASLLKHYYAIHDMAGKQIGFAPSDGTH